MCDISIRIYVSKTEKSADFEIMKVKIMLEYSDKILCFKVKLFWTVSKKFSVNCSNMSVKKQGHTTRRNAKIIEMYEKDEKVV